MSNWQSGVESFDEYCRNGKLPGAFGVAKVLLTELNQPSEGSKIARYAKLAFEVAVATRQWQLTVQDQASGIDFDADPTQKYLSAEKFKSVRFNDDTRAFLSSYVDTIPDIISKGFPVGGANTQEDVLILATIEGFDLAFRRPKSSIGHSGAAYRIYYKEVAALNALYRWVANQFWLQAPHGAQMIHRITGYETVLVPIAADLRPNCTATDPSNGQQAIVAGRIRQFYQRGIKRGVLLYGIPGTGKSTFARTICDGIAMSPRKMTVSGSLTEDSSVSEMLQVLSPDVLILDDIDRNANSASDLLHLLESFERGGPRIIVASVNDIRKLDTALLRPGRFDEVHEMALPTADYRRLLVQVHWPNIPEDTLNAILDHIDQFTPAEIHEIVLVVQSLGLEVLKVEVERLRKQRLLYGTAADVALDSDEDVSSPSLSNALPQEYLS